MSRKINIIAGIYDPYDYESITVSTTAIGFTSSKISPSDGGKAYRAMVTVETAAVRYRYDGTDPTSSEGHLLNAGDTLILVGTSAISNFKAIITDVTDSVLKVTYER